MGFQIWHFNKEISKLFQGKKQKLHLLGESLYLHLTKWKGWFGMGVLFNLMLSLSNFTYIFFIFCVLSLNKMPGYLKIMQIQALLNQAHHSFTGTSKNIKPRINTITCNTMCWCYENYKVKKYKPGSQGIWNLLVEMKSTENDKI